MVLCRGGPFFFVRGVYFVMRVLEELRRVHEDVFLHMPFR